MNAIPTLRFLILFICSVAFFSPSSFAQQNYFWKHNTNQNFSTAGNWLIGSCAGSVSGSVPGALDTITFSSCDTFSCFFNTNVNVAKIDVKTTYTGTITQNSTKLLSFKIGSFKGGKFNGGNAAINATSSLTIDGSIFTSTSDTLTTKGDVTFKSGTFNHHNGTVIFKKGTTTTTTLTGPSGTTPVNTIVFTLYNVGFDAPSATTQFNIKNMTMQVSHALTLTGSHQLFLNSNTGATIEAKGDITSANTDTVGGGSATIVINGTGTQNLTDSHGTGVSGKLPNITVFKPSGSLYLYGTLALGGSAIWKDTTGTVVEGTAKLICYYNNTLKNSSAGAMKFYNLEIQGSGGIHSLSGTVTVTNLFSTSLSGDCIINGGTLELQKDLQWNCTSSTAMGNTTYKFSGSNPQTISAQVILKFNSIILNKTSGDITLQKEIRISSNLNLTAGYIVSTATNLVTILDGATVSNVSNSSFIKGPVKKIGDDAFFFPTGKGSNYKPIAITAPSSSTHAFTAEYFNTIQPYGLTDSALTYSSTCEYWNLDRTTGASTVKVTLNWDNNSCDIYTLSTLKVGKWNGTAWASCGAVTTSGNTTNGSIQTSSYLSSYGYFLIAKNSPALSINAGNDTTINLGSSTTLGGSPTVSGGTSPYTYDWFNSYALNSLTSANPVAKPFSTYNYYLKVTDVDKNEIWDSVKVTVNGFDLKTAKNFALLAQDTIKSTTALEVDAQVGSKKFVSSNITGGSHLINTAEVDTALKHLDNAMIKIHALTPNSTINGNLSGDSYTTGIYRITGNSILDGTLTLQGDASSYFVFDIAGSLTIQHTSKIVLDGVSKSQVFFRVGRNINITDSSIIAGNFLASDSICGGTINGNCILLSKAKIKGHFSSDLKLMSVIVSLGDERPLDNFFGFNGSTVTQGNGWGSPALQNSSTTFAQILPQLHASVFRSPGGAGTNDWRWQTGWFRGYDNPLYNDLSNLNNPNVKYHDTYPRPSSLPLGLSTDFNSLQPVPDHLLDFKSSLLSTVSFPLYCLNVVSSDIGTEIGSLFYAHCNDMSVKYVEFGNEVYFGTPNNAAAFDDGAEYVTQSIKYAGQIKTYFPDVKIGIDASPKLGDSGSREETWNNTILTNHDNIDAVTFHLYPDTKLIGYDCDLATYNKLKKMEITNNLFSQPFQQFKDMESGAISGAQPELALIDDTGLEGWVTEFNIGEDEHSIFGTWAHGLYTAAMALAPLHYEDITKALCYNMAATVRYGAFMQNDNAMNNLKCVDPEDIPDYAEWTLGAVGKAMQYIGLATKQAHHATEINFTGVPNLLGDFPSVKGWKFNCYRGQDAGETITDEMSIVVNLSGKSIEIDPTGIWNSQDKFTQLTDANSFEIGGSPFVPITNLAGNKILESSPQTIGSKLTLPPYSLTLIKHRDPGKGSFRVIPVNNTACTGSQITFYLQGEGDHYITSGAGTGLPFIGSTKTITASEGTTTYHIKTMDAAQEQIVLIDASNPFSTFNLPVAVNLDNPCPGQEVELRVNPLGYFYNWYPQEEDMLDENGDKGNDTRKVTVYPEIETEYFVNVTDKKCYCPLGSRTVTKYAPANAGPDLYLCKANYTGAAVTLGDQTTTYPIDEQPTFQWSPSAGLNSTTIQHPTVDLSYQTTKTYTLTVTYHEPCTGTSTDEVTVNRVVCCEDESAVVFYPDPITPYPIGGKDLTALDFINSDDLETNANAGAVIDYIPSGIATSTLDDVAYLTNYTNPIIINGLFDVNLDLTLTGCTNLTFGPQAKIKIEPNCRLVIDDCDLFAACDEMWQGIEIDGNYYVNTDNNADNGLVIKHGSTIKDAEAAVVANNNSRFDISKGGGSAKNLFENNWEHIKASNYVDFTAKIRDNDFSASGVLLEPHPGNSSYNAINLEGIQKTSNISGNTITNARFGFRTLNAGLIASDNTITNCLKGIFMTQASQHESVIQGNTISTLSLPYPSFGIDIEDNSGADITIGGTEIDERNTINSNGIAGIYNNGAQFATILGNDIAMNESNTGGIHVYGIKVANANNNYIRDNIIDGGQPNSGQDIVKKHGIYIDASSGTQIYCNTINQVEKGLQFIGENNNIKTGANTFQIMKKAFMIGEEGIGSATLNNQFYDNNHTPGNMFVGYPNQSDHQFGLNGYALYAFDYDPFGVMEAIDYLALPCDILPYLSKSDFENQVIGTNTINGFALNFNPSGYDDCVDCSQIVLPQNVDNITSLDYAIIDNSIAFSSAQTPCYRWTLKYQLYEKLDQNPLLINEEPFTTFFDTTSDQNIGKFYQIDQALLSLFDTSLSVAEKESIRQDAIDDNSRIVSSEVFEINLQSVNSIYLNTIAEQRIDFTSEEADDLLEIANQCPYEGGEAVFIARSLYSLIDDTIVFDDHLFCTPTPKLSEPENNEAAQIFYSLYPNPTRDNITFEYFTNLEEQLKINLVDMAGRSLLNFDLAGTNGKMELNLSELSSGMYFLKLSNNSNLYATEKVTILK